MNERQEILLQLRDDMLAFGKVVMPRTFFLESPQFHKEIAVMLHDKRKRFLNIIAPRGTAKSSLIAGVFPLHHLMFDEGVKVVVISSRTQYHSILLLQYIKDVLEYSTEFRQLFGYWGQHSAKKWTNTEIILKDGSAIVCKGTGQHLRGLKVGHQRPTLIIVDDPEDENNTKTSEAMEGNLRWLLQSASPSIDPKNGRIVCIGTPLHERCLIFTLREMNGWITMHYHYLNTDINGTVTSLWAEMRSVETLNQIKKDLDGIGKLSVFYKEYMCEVIGDEDQLFKESYLRYYDGEYHPDGYIELKDANGVTERKVRVNVYMGIDPASSTRQTADYSTIVPIGVDDDNNRYVLDYFRRRVTPLDFADNILAYYRKYLPKRTRVESVGYQEMLREYLKVKSREQNIYIPGLEIKELPRTSKSLRLESLQPFFARGKYFVKHKHKELIDELLLFPRGKHDDLLDGLFYASKNVVPASKEEIKTDSNKNFYRRNGEKSWMAV